MSHELRTPLNSIMGYTQLLHLKGHLNDKQQHYVNEMYTSSKHLLSLINGLLDLSKIEAGEMSLIIECIDIKQALNQIIFNFEPIINTTKQEIKIKLDSSLSFFNLDPVKFHQILLNLVSNALKFSPEKSVVTITASLKNKELFCTVTDQGKGIDQDIRDILFDRFTQKKQLYKASLDHQPSHLNNHHANATGTGLGLSLCKALVDLHGGNIWLDPSYNKGARLCFTIPSNIKTDNN